jgi:hypothetical protein
MERHLSWLALTHEQWLKLHSDPDSAPWCTVSDCKPTQELHLLASPRSSAPPGYQNTWGWGWCACHTTFRQPGWNHGTSLSHQHKSIQYIWNLAFAWAFQSRWNRRGYTVSTTVGFWNLIMEALRPIITSLNPATVPAVSYEYLFCLPSSDRLRPPARRKAQGLLSGSCTLGTVGRWLWPNNLDMTSSLQWQNGCGTIHPVPDMAPPLLARGEGPPI